MSLAAAGLEMSMEPLDSTPAVLRSWRSGWAASTAPRCPGESISGTTSMCRLLARPTMRRTSSWVRAWSETTSGWDFDSIRKAWSSEKCRPSWLSLRSPISRMRSSIHSAL
ncbi:hypothetical protein GA0115255_109442 [Streptomyces sp. Ncost-T6T-2b]|nr:hypothetical protein GA0115255_109442 [Streptomyces sp. Ncost-T6T-2b]